jgi:hypothetical protein
MRQHRVASRGRLLRQKRMDRAPQSDATACRGLAQALHLLLVRTQREAEHVGDHLLAHALALELAHEGDEDFVCHV